MDGKRINFNFFDWIRAGVRQAVLMGVADAVDDIGQPGETDDSNRRLLEILRGNESVAGQEPRLAAEAKPQRRKLGRSLRDTVGAEHPAETAADAAVE